MAVLTSAQLAELRQGCASSAAAAGAPVNYTKAQLNAALQAVEDWFENTGRAAIGAAIEAAAPGLFNAAAKKRIAAYWLRQKFAREGV